MLLKWRNEKTFLAYVGGVNKTVTDPGVGCEPGVTLVIVSSAVPVVTFKEGGWTKYKVPGTYQAGEGTFPGYKAGDLIMEATLQGDITGDTTDAKFFVASAKCGVPEYDNHPTAPYKYNGMPFGDLGGPPPPLEEQ